MFGPSAKYRGQPAPDGRELFWDGHPDHYPMPGPPDRLMTADEVAGAEAVYNARYRYFCLPADAAAYLDVKDRYAGGMLVVDRELVSVDAADPAKVHAHVWWFEIEARPGRPVPPPAPGGIPWMRTLQ